MRLADLCHPDRDRFAGLARATHGLLRVGAGFLYFEHGLQKLFGVLGGFGGPGHTVELLTRFGLAGIIETFGGALLILGLFTRPVAFVIMVEMLCAYFIAHFPQGGWPIQNRGELPLLYAVIAAFFVGNGPGPGSLDAKLRGREGRGG